MYLADMYCWLLICNIYYLNLSIYLFNIYVKDTQCAKGVDWIACG